MFTLEKNVYICRTSCRDFFFEWGDRRACVRGVEGKQGQHVLSMYAAFRAT